MSENEANIVAGDANAPTEETSTAAATEETPTAATEETSTVATEETPLAETSPTQPEARQTESTTEAQAEPEPEASTEEISYHAVEKDGHVTALWEMQGRKHLRTIDPRSRQGQEVLRLYTSEHPEEIGSEEVGSGQ